MLIVDLGGFAGETQQLLGSLLMTSLEQAAFSRRTLVSQERRPFFCIVDEFPLFCARDSTTLARILSESRKYRLHLGLAHQTISQLPTERLQGTIENAKLKVVFGTGRHTAEAIVKELFMPDLTSVKHEVENTEAQERTHPIFDPMMEQFEKFTQMIQRLRRQHVLVTLPESETVATVRVPTVPPSRVSSAHLERLKTYLARQWGRPRRDLEQEIDTRTRQLTTGWHNGVPVQNKRAKMDFWVSAAQTRKTPLSLLR
jgi:type IV secretory pathway TraG/TraD family ATPase VirD4